MITPPGNAQINCSGNTNIGIAQSIAGPPTGSDNTLFPTNVPGISYRLYHIAGADSYNMASYPNNNIAAGNYSLTGTTQLFLYYTGPYLPPNNGSITGALSQWNFDVQTCTGPRWNQTCTTSPQPFEFFNISATILINVPTCNIGTSANGGPNFAFTLPNVTTTQLAANPTPGLTPVNIPLINCPAGQKVFITLNTSAPYTTGGVNGVIAPSGTGYATGVGVQVLQADGATPITFGSTFGGAGIGGTGVATGSSFTVNLFARYFKTSATVTPGPVQGVATYTMNYQ